MGRGTRHPHRPGAGHRRDGRRGLPDPDTGELYGWSATDVEPYITLHWVRPDGTVRSRELWDAPYSQWAHDMWLSERYMVLALMQFQSRSRQGR